MVGNRLWILRRENSTYCFFFRKRVLEWAKDHLKIDDDGRFYEYYNDKGDLVGTYHNWFLKRIKKV